MYRFDFPALPRIVLRIILFLCCLPFIGSSPGFTQTKYDFFEKRIRPVLIEHCYQCHNSSDRDDGSLALDSRAGLLDGGDSGPAVVPGKPKKSLLISAIRHTNRNLRMPQNNAKLSKQVIADFEKWIASGAPDPRDKPPTADALAKSTSWETVRDKRKKWWSFQPINHPKLPPASKWSQHPVDRFIFQKLKQKELTPSKRAAKRTLIRRAYHVAIGLPPTPEEVDSFVADTSPDAYPRLIDSLINKPAFGERWARHWMDWVRYSESHGSEGNPTIPFAFQYRDYLIRALNRDTSYRQLVLEHIAGDLLENPRIDSKLGLNESKLGVGHYRFVEHGYGPTDALEEQVRFTENQIDVISKAFLGLTVSCARCHDHKFDAISQADFYAFYGMMINSRSANLTVDSPQKLDLHKRELRQLKKKIKAELVEYWLSHLSDFSRKLESLPAPTTNNNKQPNKNKPSAIQRLVNLASQNPRDPLHVWLKIKSNPKEIEAIWKKLNEQFTDSRARLFQRANQKYVINWNLASSEHQNWTRHGSGLDKTNSKPGEFHVLAAGNKILSNIYPAGIYTHRLSNKHSGILTSPNFDIQQDELWVRVAGGGGARVRYVVQNYPRVSGPVYKAAGLNSETSRWIRWDMKYWRGDRAHIEVANAMDIPVESRNNARSWFGITDVVTVHGKQLRPRDEVAEFVAPLFSNSEAPKTVNELKQRFVEAIRESIVAWREDRITNEQARFLGYFARHNLVANSTQSSKKLDAITREFRKLESAIAVPTRAPGIIAAENRDHPMFVRGNHKRSGKMVPRRYLEAFDTTPYKKQNARLQLAQDFVADNNPLMARVMVNRIWHHVFNQGIVTTTDNFGRLGTEPTHPQLLDYLAVRFKKENYSIKKMIRLMLTSETFQLSSNPSDRSREVDPNNRLLSHMSVRRLEAESIRDKMFAVSGQLQQKLYGPSVDGNTPRRSVYVAVRRNALDPFLTVFDAPAPFSTKGVRDVTNVPAQSLAMMNNALVQDLAIKWVESVVKNPEFKNDRDRIKRLFKSALGRKPSPQEISESLAFLKDVRLKSEYLKDKLKLHTVRINFLTEHLEKQLIGPTRKKILAARKSGAAKPIDLKPIAHWKFDKDMNDSIGQLHGKPIDNARIENGRLVLDGRSFVATKPLAQNLEAKTLTAWVSIKDIQQQGGGVMTVQTLNGSTFDSIVFAERQKQRWMAGSNFFARTRDFNGPAEVKSEKSDLVHIAITYSSDGTITCYRNGKLYGKPYKTSLQKFSKQNTQVLFGLRHGTPSKRTTHFRGSVDRASLYDRALSQKEIELEATGNSDFVSSEEIEKQLTAEQLRVAKQLRREIQSENEARKKILADGPIEKIDPWHELGKAIFSFKEFIYVR